MKLRRCPHIFLLLFFAGIEKNINRLNRNFLSDVSGWSCLFVESFSTSDFSCRYVSEQKEIDVYKLCKDLMIFI